MASEPDSSVPTAGPEPFTEFLRAVKPKVEETLDRLLPSAAVPPQRLNTAIRYAIFAGGKRVRPALVVLSGESLGATRDDLLPGAAALEMVHTFSLVHDDLPALDNDDLRRGRPTVHRAFDESTAILAGDALLNLGLGTLADEPQVVPAERRALAVSLVARAIGTDGMLGGQVADLEAEASWPEDAQAALESIHRRKTGALLTASVRLGGLYAGAAQADDAALTRLGQCIGLLFQIGDDILDVERSTEELGKTAGKDAASSKLTYPGLYGVEESKSKLSSVAAEALDLAHGLSGGAGLFPSLVSYLVSRDH
jgi:geranylgeranyl pyrophosphate synthase